MYTKLVVICEDSQSAISEMACSKRQILELVGMRDVSFGSDYKGVSKNIILDDWEK